MTQISETQATGQRRRYSKAFKADIVAQCQMAGASVARIARNHHLNANMVHRWMKDHASVVTEPALNSPAVLPGFVPVALPAPVTTVNHPPIEMSIPHSGGTIVLRCPAQQVGPCAALLREWLA